MTLAELPDWLRIVLMASATTAAFCILFGKVGYPLFRALRTIDELLPVVLKIATEFKTNGGSSLKDTVDRLAFSVSEASKQAIAAHARNHEMLNTLTVIRGFITALATRDPALKTILEQNALLAKVSAELAPSPPVAGG